MKILGLSVALLVAVLCLACQPQPQLEVPAEQDPIGQGQLDE